jgi:hypothetical protein
MDIKEKIIIVMLCMGKLKWFRFKAFVKVTEITIIIVSPT